MKYQKEVQIDRGILKVGSGIPGYILSEEASIQLITKKGRRLGLQIRMLKLQRKTNGDSPSGVHFKWRDSPSRDCTSI